MLLSKNPARDMELLLHAMSRLALVLETDHRGRILRTNERFEQLSGFHEAKLRGRTPRSLRSGIHPPLFWKQLWRTLGQGRTWQGQICNRARDGRFYWIEVMVLPIATADKRVEKYLCVGHHIANSRLDVASMVSNQNMLIRTTSIAGVGGWYLDLRTQRLFMTDACLGIFGLEPSSCNDACVNQVYFEPRSLPAALVALATTVSVAGSTERVEEFRLPSGAKRFIRLLGELDLHDGQPSRVIGAAQDITEQVTAQRGIEESQRILRSAIDEFGEAFALFDPQERLVFCNDLYRGIYRIRDDEAMVGMRFEDILQIAIERGAFPGVDRHDRSWAVKRLEAFRRPRFEHKKQLADGRWLKSIDRTTPDQFHVGFRIDITDMQRALEATDAASRSKSQFLANMSHEIRTPMNAVLGMLELLSHTGLSARQGDLVQKASNAAGSLLGILNDILDYSKVEVGKMQLDLEPFVLDHLLCALSTILSGTIGSKPVELVFDIDPEIPAMLIGDALRLKQALINLCGNAIKFTSEGEVVLGLKLQRLDRATARVAFSVRDTGIGITREQQQRIFSGFSQADAATARLYGGTGLGLSISQRLVGLMGGQLTVDSVVGQGSTFSFEIELPIARKWPAHLPQRTDVRMSGLSVLLVEDKALTRAAVARMLGGLGWSVQALSSEAAALAWLEASFADGSAPDVVLMNAGLPSGSPLRQHCNDWQSRKTSQLLPPIRVNITSAPVDLLRDCDDIWCVTLVKPLTAGMVFDAVASLRLGGPTRGLPAVSAPSLRRLAGLRLLLVEDNLINQEIGLEVLRREGAQVDLAENGQEGVAAVNQAETAYDLVLMDMQMPKMDGLLATQVIRRNPRHQALPILAMTAYAMQEDRDACLVAGMNGHVSKPLDINHLVRTILEHTGRLASADSTAAGAAAPSTQPEPPAQVLGAAQAIRRLGHDPVFYARLLESFPRSARELAKRLRLHVAQGETRAAAALAHQLKGAAAAVGAERLAAACGQFEQQARAWSGMAQPTEATPCGVTKALLLHAIDEALEQVLAVQAQWQPPASAMPLAAESPGDALATLQSDLAALLAALRDGEMEVFERFEALSRRHGHVPAATWEPLRRAIEQFDPDAAEQAASDFLETISSDI
ncbi:response regulator [Malikia sp.]|uniref:response regulator n=1 Tax=Malikia sp. TaxID=2070706 RepID=UPI002633196C|nr:response regulator [Malikia sp.]MDD2729995.1 response regulator [Malikia sp.]